MRQLQIIFHFFLFPFLFISKKGVSLLKVHSQYLTPIVKRWMTSIAIFSFLLLSPIQVHAVDIWTESFTNQEGKGATGSSEDMTGITTWTINVDDSNWENNNDWFRVQNEVFEGRDLDHAVTWTSSSIDISAYQNVEFSLDVTEAGNLEDADYVDIYYSVDGGSFTRIPNWNGLGDGSHTLHNDFAAQTIDQAIGTAASLQIRVIMRNNAGNEYYRFDNVLVTGDSAVTGNYSCPGEDVEFVNGAIGDAYKAYTTGVDIAENSRYFQFTTAVDGDITIRQQNNKPVGGYWNHRLRIGTVSCSSGTYFYSGPNTSDDSHTFSVTAGTPYYVRVEERDNQNVLNFDISFDFKANIVSSNAPNISISPTTLTVGQGDSVNLNVDLDVAGDTGSISVDYGGTCGESGTVNIPQGSPSGSISFTATALMPTPCTVVLSNPVGNNGQNVGIITSSTSTITITPPSNAPNISITPTLTQIPEGNASVNLSVQLNEAGDTGSIAVDYSGCGISSTTLNFAQGVGAPQSITVDTSSMVNGDSCTVTLSNLRGTGGGQSVGTIVAPGTATINVTAPDPIDPDFVQCGLFPGALNTWDTINRGSGDIVLDGDSVYADNGVVGVGNQDIECTLDGITADCLIKPMPEEIPTLPTFIPSPTSGSHTANGVETDESYGDVTVNNGNTVAFSPSGTYTNGKPVMLINSINIEDGATVTFSEGDYWIGSWISAQSVTIRTNGKVRLFIDNDLDLTENHLDFNYDNNTGLPANMFIFIYGNFNFASQGGGVQQDVVAYVYVEGEYTGNHNTANSHFRGAVTAVNDINLNNNHEYTYDDSGLIDGWGDCCVYVQWQQNEYQVAEDFTNPIPPSKTVNTVIELPGGPVAYDVEVDYTTVDATAVGGTTCGSATVDYITASGTATIYAGNSTVTVPITICNDSPIELEQYFYVDLSNPQPDDKVCLGDLYRTQVTILAQEDAPVCFENDFGDGTGALDSLWRVLENPNSGNTYTPQVVSVNGDGRLRMTDDRTNLATVVTKDYTFNTTENLIIVEFDYYAYGGCNGGGLGTYGADGIVSVLFDSDVGNSPVPGARGGALGFAQMTATNPNQDGFEGGWLGLGLDEYGNYSNPNEGKVGGPGFRTNAVSIRGDGSGISGYEYLEGTTALTPVLAQKTGYPADGYFSGRYKMTVDARDPAHLYIRLERSTTGNDNDYAVIISQFDAKDSGYGQGQTPELVRYAMTAGTGGGCNNHELSWIKLRGNCEVYAIATTTGPFDAWDTFRDIDDRNISTKVVNRDFDLTIASINAQNNGVHIKTGINAKYQLEDMHSHALLGTEGDFNASVDSTITASFNDIDSAHQDVRVRFEVCSDYDYLTGVYTLFPHRNCSSICGLTDSGLCWRHWHSSDNLAIRPDRFFMETPPATIRAGIGYNLDYEALDAINQRTQGYSNAPSVSTALNPPMAGCLNQTIDINSSLAMTNGLHDGNLTATHFNTVGDFNITLYEESGSEFANVDADDTPFSTSEALEITPYTIDLLHIVPADFDLTSTFTNSNTVNNFTYLHDMNGSSKSMSADLNVNVQAMIADGSNAENYESDCYAAATDFYVDFNYTEITPAASLSELYYDKNATPSASGSVNILTASGTSFNNGNFSMNFPDTLFPADQEGSADINISINFDRQRNLPVNPLRLRINDVNLTEDDNEVSSEELVGINATYYYGRVTSSQYFYDDVTANNINTPIIALVYCNLWAGCTAFGIDTALGQTDDDEWWVSRAHNRTLGDGNITLITPIQNIDIDGGTGNAPFIAPNVTNITTNGQDPNINVDSGGSADLPMEVHIRLNTTTETLTSPWMVYNADSAIIDPIPFYKVKFIDLSGWSGVGATGNVVDTNGSSQKTRRLNW